MDNDEAAARDVEVEFWGRLSELEAKHQKIQNEHEVARRALDGASRERVEELKRVWCAYCRVIEQLDETAAALEYLQIDIATNAVARVEAITLPSAADAQLTVNSGGRPAPLGAPSVASGVTRA